MGFHGLSTDEQFEAIRAYIAAKSGKPSALGACIFGGGFSMGMEQAGFRVAGHLELPDLALGADVSRQRWPVAVAPLERWQSFVDGLISDGLVPDVLFANPPCVAYAGTGKHGGSGDARMCYTRYCSYETGLRLKPIVWMWELVPGIFGQERHFLDAMAFRARRDGYRCYAFLTTSSIHGGYQDRRRFHFVASKLELDFEGTFAREPEERRKCKSLGDALDVVVAARTTAEPLYNDSNVYKGCFQDIMPFCPPGTHLRDVPSSVMAEHYKPRGQAWSGHTLPGFPHTRGRRDRPSPNVMGGHTIIHPEEDRYLTPRECATIMGFPIDYRFSAGSKAYQEIGRGLCTHNAAFLGRVVLDALVRGVRTVPTRSTEKGHEESWLQAVDWRTRGDKLSLKYPVEDQAKWWRARHGTEPPADLGL
jgi:DNA (cytosine-5)-methyltransferase 1